MGTEYAPIDESSGVSWSRRACEMTVLCVLFRASLSRQHGSVTHASYFEGSAINDGPAHRELRAGLGC